jgi:hypothetical protein
MGNFLIVLGFLIICSAPLSVYASELLGRISTMPTVNTEPASEVPEAANPVTTVAANSRTSGSASAPVNTGRPAGAEIVEPPVLTEKSTKVLGQKIYPDDSLVKDETGRIFLLQGLAKKPIRTLLELEKYRRQAIYQASSDDLSRYQTLEHLAGDLIRQKNDVKVYVLKKGPKHHILNLLELAKGYFGLPIHNLEPDEMEKYE